MNIKINLEKEIIFALLVITLIFSMVLYEVPTFSTVMNAGEEFSEMWSDENTKPPVPHVERLTLIECADFLEIPLKKFRTVYPFME
jgi:hypothetical protein